METHLYLPKHKQGGGPGGRTPHKIREIRVTTSKIDPEDFSLGKNGSSTPVHKWQREYIFKYINP